jgi:hypothetical protein
MPPIRNKHVLIECPFEDCDGSVFQSFSRRCLVDHPYDIRYRGTAVLGMRLYREQELYAQWAALEAAEPTDDQNVDGNNIRRTKRPGKAVKAKENKEETVTQRETQRTGTQARALATTGRTVGEVKASPRNREKTVLPIPADSEVRIVLPKKEGYLADINQLAVLPPAPPLTLFNLTANALRFVVI